MPRMAARWRIEQRAAKKEELDQLRHRARMTSEIVFLCVFALPLLAMAAGALVSWSAPVGIPVAIVLVLLALAVMLGFGEHLLVARRKMKHDLARGVVELVVVDGADTVLATSDGDPVHPLFAFELEGDKALALIGQWLWGKRIYGCESSDVIETDLQGNGLPAPWSFPATAFTVHRLPASGDVLHIEVRGAPLKPIEYKILGIPAIGDSYVVDRWW
jgi:hypothetical protein